jgi:hypothetical protein
MKTIQQLPGIHPFDVLSIRADNCKKLLLISEGFEQRCTSWISGLPVDFLFENCLVFHNIPERETRLVELLLEVKKRTRRESTPIIFNRFDPIQTEFVLRDKLSEAMVDIDEVLVDISVMSKLLIMMIFFILKDQNIKLRCIYSEPTDYIPSEKEYAEFRHGMAAEIVRFPTFGVHDVVRTPLLSSSVMQNCPSILVAFTSFNEQLVRALLSNSYPTHFYLINGIPPYLLWRERATQEIHHQVIEEYQEDNLISSNGDLVNRVSTLDYRDTFTLLADLYRKNCYNYRIVVAPTGSKMQTLGVAMMKSCCPDIHIEYPMPESFFMKGYSSTEIRNTHEVVFDNYRSCIRNIAEIEHLNG